MGLYDISIVSYILSFNHSFDFHKVTKSPIIWNNYFGFEHNQEVSLSLLRDYILLDYFLHHRHLLLLDTWTSFSSYFYEHYSFLCGHNLKSKFQNKKQVYETQVSKIPTCYVKNIARLSYFVSCLRRIELHQRQKTKDKMEQTNIGICFQYLIENVNNQSEIELEMVKNMKH